MLKELQENPSTLKLKPHIREYVGLLSAMQEAFRSATAKSRDTWVRYIAAAQADFFNKFPESIVGLAALPVDERGLRAGEPVYLTGPVINYLTYLQRRTNEMVNYAQRCVVY